MNICKTDKPKYYPFIACAGDDNKCGLALLEEIDYEPEKHEATYNLSIQFKQGTLAFSKDPVLFWYYLTYGSSGCRTGFTRKTKIAWNWKVALGGYTYTKQFTLKRQVCEPRNAKIVSFGLYQYPLLGSFAKPRGSYYGLGCDMEIELEKQPGIFNIYYATICVPMKYGLKVPNSIIRIILKDGTALEPLGWADHTETVNGEEMICFRANINKMKVGSTKFEAHVIIPMKK